MTNQRTPRTEVNDGLARQIGRMVEDAIRCYPGGTANANLAKGHPDFAADLYAMLDNLAAKQAIRMPLLKRPPFATIEVGTFATTADIRQAMANNGFSIEALASDLMDSYGFTLLAEPAMLNLYSASNKELGYPEGCTLKESFLALEKIGAKRLLPEVGVQYCLQYKDQPPNGWQMMYMDPIIDSYGDLRAFCIERYDCKPMLSSKYGCNDNHSGGRAVWIFTRE